MLQSLTDKISRVGLSSFIEVFNGDNQAKFIPWIKSIDKCAVINNLPEDQKIHLAFQYSVGRVSDFIQRHLEHNNNVTWEQLKRELESRFGEIKSREIKFAELTKLRQKPSENVQNFAERILTLAEDAYPNIGNDLPVVEQQLIMFFTDGLSQSSVRSKIIRENPRTFQDAVRVATTEQNICERIKQRSNTQSYELKDSRHVARDSEDGSRSEEPMDINYARRRVIRCTYCRMKGHVISDCRRRQAAQINEIRQEMRRTAQNDSQPIKKGKCWFCGKQGHFQAECREWLSLQGARPSRNRYQEN